MPRTRGPAPARGGIGHRRARRSRAGNPELLLGVTPPASYGYQLKVPAEHREAVEQALAGDAIPLMEFRVHVVKAGRHPVGDQQELRGLAGAADGVQPGHPRGRAPGGQPAAGAPARAPGLMGRQSMIRCRLRSCGSSLAAAVEPVVAAESADRAGPRLAGQPASCVLDAIARARPGGPVDRACQGRRPGRPRIAHLPAAARGPGPTWRWIPRTRSAKLAAEDAAFFESLHALARAARPEAVFLSPISRGSPCAGSSPCSARAASPGTSLPAREAALRRPLGYAASRAFTGLVIHAQGPLPSVGTGTTAVLRPALFPRIWDENMDLVLEKAHVRAAALAGVGHGRVPRPARRGGDPAARGHGSAARRGACRLRHGSPSTW